MSPTVFHYRNYRFFFFSREEQRPHVHVRSPDGEAKFWLEPTVELAVSRGLNEKELRILQKIVIDKQYEIREHWRKHFGS